MLSVNGRAYERIDWHQINEIPPKVSVQRAFALDAKRHLSLGSYYPRWLALPDRWASWCLSGIPIGLLELYKKRIDVIYTTFPIATAVFIGLILRRITGKPWVVDFRDSMTEENYPADPLTWRICRWIERQAIKHGSSLIFTAESAKLMYLARYPKLSPERCSVICNGYDEEDFSFLEVGGSFEESPTLPIRLLHAGLIYPEERDPRPFFRALARLKREDRVNSERLRIDLRASGSESYYADIIRELGIADIVHLLPALPYRESLRDGANAHGLLLLQAGSCNHQIPAKAYEYMRLQKPILALTPETGDTAALLREVGGATIMDLADENALYSTLPAFLNRLYSGEHPLPDWNKTQRYSRRSQALELAKCLERLFPEVEPAGIRDAYS